jgi:hypothetical protein
MNPLGTWVGSGWPEAFHDLVVVVVGGGDWSADIRVEKTNCFLAPFVPDSNSHVLGKPLPSWNLDREQKKTFASRFQEQFIPTAPEHNGAIGLSIGLLC